jgi:hypothetical protein
MIDHLKSLVRAHRRAAVSAAIVGGVVCTFAAGAVAMRGEFPGKARKPEVKLEHVSDREPVTTVSEPKTTTTKKKPPKTTTTKTEPSTTTTTEAPPPPPPPPPPPYETFTFEAPGAGTMTVKLEWGVLTVIGYQPFEGWTAEVYKDSGTDFVKVMFRQGNVVKWVKAWLKEGTVVPETGGWTECTTVPEPVTETYEVPGAGTVRVAWDGQKFTVVKVTPLEGWTVAYQDAPGSYVYVAFAPVVEGEASVQTDGGGGDGKRWIKVKIHDCEIVTVVGD